MSASKHVYRITIGDRVLPVEGGQVTMDETWAPYVDASVVIKNTPDIAEMIEAVDPRQTPVPRVQLVAQKWYRSGLQVSDLTNAGMVVAGNIPDSPSMLSDQFSKGLSTGSAVPGALTRQNLFYDPYPHGAAAAWTTATAGTVGVVQDLTHGKVVEVKKTSAANAGAANPTWTGHSFPLSVSTAYTIRFDVLFEGVALGTAVAFYWRPAGTSSTTGQVVIRTNLQTLTPGWNTFEINFNTTATAPVGAATLTTVIPTAYAAGTRVLFRNVTLRTGTTTDNDVFDGDDAGTATNAYTWDSTPNLSISNEHLWTVAFPPSQRLDLDLHVRERTINDLDGTVTLSLASDEALLQDLGGRRQDDHTYANATEAMDAPLRLGLFTRITTGANLGTVLEAETRLWERFYGHWDYLEQVAAALEAAVWCDEGRKWRMLAYTGNLGDLEYEPSSATILSNIRVASRNGGWADAVRIRYRDDPATGKPRVRGAYPPAGPGVGYSRSLELTWDKEPPPITSTYPIALRRRRAVRASAISLADVSDYTIRPRYRMWYTLGGANVWKYVQSVTWNFTTDEMSYELRDFATMGD